MPSIEERIQQTLPAFAPGGLLLLTWPLKGGISASMTAFEVRHSDGSTRKYIARQPGDWSYNRDPRAAHTEFQVLKTLRETGLPVPNPITVEASQSPDTHEFFIIQYTEGEARAFADNPQTYIQAFAKTLAHIHQTPWQGSALADLPRLSENPYRSSDEAKVLLPIEEDIYRALDRHSPTSSPNGLVLNHGDYWPGNILWQEDQVVAVIDWEGARIGDPFMDLSIARLDILWILGPEAMDEMTAIYQVETNFDLSTLTYWDLRVGLRPIGEFERMAPAYPHLGRTDITAETMSKQHEWFVEQGLSRTEPPHTRNE